MRPMSRSAVKSMTTHATMTTVLAIVTDRMPRRTWISWCTELAKVVEHAAVSSQLRITCSADSWPTYTPSN